MSDFTAFIVIPCFKHKPLNPTSHESTFLVFALLVKRPPPPPPLPLKALWRACAGARVPMERRQQHGPCCADGGVFLITVTSARTICGRDNTKQRAHAGSRCEHGHRFIRRSPFLQHYVPQTAPIEQRCIKRWLLLRTPCTYYWSGSWGKGPPSEPALMPDPVYSGPLLIRSACERARALMSRDARSYIYST